MSDPAPIPSPTPETIRALAVSLDVHPRTIQRALRAGLPVETDGTVDTEKARTWLRARARAAHRRGPASALGEFQSEQRKRYGGGPLTAEELLMPPGDPAPPARRDVGEALAEANLEWRRARTELEKLRVGKLRGNYMERTKVVEMVTGWVRAFRDGLLALEGRVAHLVSDEARALIRHECRDLLQAFADAGRALNRYGDQNKT